MKNIQQLSYLITAEPSANQPSTHSPLLHIFFLLSALCGFVTLSIYVINASQLSEFSSSTELMKLSVLSVLALCFAYMCIQLNHGRWIWTMMPILTPLLYYAVGNILFLLK